MKLINRLISIITLFFFGQAVVVAQNSPTPALPSPNPSNFSTVNSTTESNEFATSKTPATSDTGNTKTGTLTNITPEERKKLEEDAKNKTDPNNENKNIFIKIDELLLGKNQVNSLMFNKESFAEINRALDAYNTNQVFNPGGETTKAAAPKTKAAKAPEENVKSYVYLSSILYFAPNNWSVWINGTKITSGNNREDKELFIKKIDGDKAEVVWKLSISKWKILSGKKSETDAPNITNNRVELNFTLKPNQTYILGSAKVVEGRKL